MSNSEQIFVVGALVQWTAGKGYGVVQRSDNRLIHVRWDNPDPDIPQQFVGSDPPLERVNLRGQVARRQSTGQELAVLDIVDESRPVWRCRVFSPTGKSETTNVPEEDIRPLPNNDPVERFRAGKIGSLKKYRLHEVTRWYRTQNNHNDLVSLEQVQVDIKPHQVSVAHKVISNYPHRFLLCDEVGLGKTIEAGMVLKELRSRGGAQRVLTIVPPNLIRQWQFEMKSKFNESFSVLNTATVSHLKNQGFTGNPFTHPHYSSVLCSWRWAANPRWAQLCAEAEWDFIIVDEAHHARSHPDGTMTGLYRLVRDLSQAEHISKRGMLFLTATPMQMNTHELYALVEILDPALFPSPEDFEQHRRAVPGLSKLVERLYQHGFPLPSEHPDDTIAQVAKWLDIEQTTAEERLNAAGTDRARLEQLAEELGDKHRLSEVLIRNRKAVVGGFMPRSANRWEVELTPSEHAALKAVEEYVQYGYQLAEGRNDNAVGFVMVIFQKLLASSIVAIKVSLGNRRKRIQENAASTQSAEDLEDNIDDDLEVGEVVNFANISDMPIDEEISLLDHAIKKLDEVKIDSKAKVFIDQLTKLFNEYPNEKVIVFTQFRETQRYLKEQIASNDWGVALFHGQLASQEKDDAIINFRNSAGPQVLIATEAGGEGRNLQFSHLLVNYDLPWNPMRVEQRIGRVDRIGQEHAISIFNLWVKGTIEERVLDMLEMRIRIFEETVGGLDPILGDTEHDIRKAMRLADDQRKQTLDVVGRRKDEQIRQARVAGELFGDFIMDTKSYRKEIAERIVQQPSPINNDDREQFIKQLLDDVKTRMNPVKNLYMLTFREDQFETPNSKGLFSGRYKMKAVLRPDIRPDAQDVEFMAFGHKVIDAIVAQILSEDYEGSTGTRRIFADSELSPTSGWLFTYQFTTSGVRPVEEVVPVFVSDSGEVDSEIGHILLQRAIRFDDEEDEIPWNKIPDNISNAESMVNEFVGKRREEIHKHAESESQEKADREISKLKALYDYKERRANDKVDSTRKTLNRIRQRDDQSARRILPVWEAKLADAELFSERLSEERHHRIAEIEKHRFPQIDWALKSLGRIEIVDYR